MQDTKLFETILVFRHRGRAAASRLDTTGERVDLWAEHTQWPCPQCQQALRCRDHAEERVRRLTDE